MYSFQEINDADNTSNFDYFKLVQMWPQTTCWNENGIWEVESNVSPCTMPKHKNWTTHGLWPTASGTRGPNFCKSSNGLDPEVEEKLLEDLEEHWLNYKKSGSNKKFWDAQWNKHGTCSQNDQYSYFKMAIDLIKKFNVGKILEKDGIVPGFQYKLGRIYSAVENVFRSHGIVVFAVNPNTGKRYLKEIHLCFNKELHPMDCETRPYDPNLDIFYPKNLPSRNHENWSEDISEDYLRRSIPTSQNRTNWDTDVVYLRKNTS